MFPYRDDNPTLKTPFITAGIIVITVIAWVVVQGAGSEVSLAGSVCTLGAIPGELLGTVPAGTRVPLGPEVACVITDQPAWYTVVTSVFLHGGWFHLIGNMWFLWIFGNNVEDSMGHVRFVVFYLVAGVLAALAQIFATPGSAVPMVGASGAISGIMGAYLVLYPRVRVHMLVFLGWVFTIAVPAWVMLIYWALLQAAGGLPALGEMERQEGGVAFLAHLGGFIAGAALIKLFARRDLVEAHRVAIANHDYRRSWQRGAF